MVSKSTILITGATGFVGSHLVECLLKKEYRVIILKRTFSDTTRINHLLDKIEHYDINKCSLDDVFSNNNIDCIIHLATDYGRENNVKNVIASNIVYPLSIIETACKYNVKAFINTDTFINTGDLKYDYLKSYVLSKRQLNEWLGFFSNKMKMFNMKLQHVFGERDSDTKFIPWIIKEICKNKKEIKLTKGEHKRDFIYVKDVAKAYCCVLDNINIQTASNNINVGTGIKISLKELVIKIKNIIKKNFNKDIDTFLNFGGLDYRENEFMDVESNIKELQKLGMIFDYNIDSGIYETVKYYLRSE